MLAASVEIMIAMILVAAEGREPFVASCVGINGSTI
jgi:hypothetical protein